MSRSPKLDLNRRHAAVLTSVVLAVLVVGTVLVLAPAAPGRPARASTEVEGRQAAPTTSTTLSDGELTLVVEPSLRPGLDEVDGLDDGDGPRPVGRIRDGQGADMDLVLDELVVVSESAAQLAAFLERWDAEVVHSYEPEPDGSQDHLVRIDGADVVDGSDPALLAEVAAGIVAMEPYHRGEMALGDASLVGLLAVIAHETNEGGPVVSPNFVTAPVGIAERSMVESGDRGDAWGWSYLRDGGTFDYGVTGAWELLHEAGRLDRRVNVLVFDGGFSRIDDLPDDATLRLADWGDSNPGECSGGPCPWHGTDVAVTALGAGDNGFGSVGPGAPVGHLVAVERDGDVYSQLRDLVEMVDIEFANIVNLSYSFQTSLAQAGHRYSFDRRLTKIDDRALIVAAAGNDGVNVDAESCDLVRCWENNLHMPCESVHVLCVGGLARGAAERADGSNYGTDTDGETVELYAPMEVVVPELDEGTGEPTGGTRWVPGTSVASPFVAGIAALMESATEHQITPGELQDLLVRTANRGDIGAEVTGHERWVNARAAALDLLGVESAAPSVAITSHTDDEEIVAEDFYAFSATATDFLGRSLPVTWRSGVDGDLGTTAPGTHLGADLSIGTHTIEAAATDFLGVTTRAYVRVVVVDNPPMLQIGAPVQGAEYLVGQTIPLVGHGQDPDTWLAVTDPQVEWEIARSNGTVLGHWNGRIGEMETAAWGAGTYRITFRTVDGAVSESLTVTVVNPPPGTPVVDIDDPVNGATVGGAAFGLSGSATVDGVAVSGTRFRWTATAGDEELVLCTGSAFHGPAPGSEPGLTSGGPTVDCSSTTAALHYVQTGDTIGTTVWTIRLEVRGPSGQIGSDEVAVSYVHAVG